MSKPLNVREAAGKKNLGGEKKDYIFYIEVLTEAPVRHITATPHTHITHTSILAFSERDTRSQGGEGGKEWLFVDDTHSVSQSHGGGVRRWSRLISEENYRQPKRRAAVNAAAWGGSDCSVVGIGVMLF